MKRIAEMSVISVVESGELMLVLGHVNCRDKEHCGTVRCMNTHQMLTSIAGSEVLAVVAEPPDSLAIIKEKFYGTKEKDGVGVHIEVD